MITPCFIVVLVLLISLIIDSFYCYYYFYYYLLFVYRYSACKAFKAMLCEVNDLAGQHEVIAENLRSDVIKEINCLVKDIKDERKKVHNIIIIVISIWWFFGHIYCHCCLVAFTNYYIFSYSCSKKA